MAINLKSVMTSGIVAGIAINVCGIALVPLLGNDMDIVLSSRGLPPLSDRAMAYFGIMSLVLGIFIVWLYANIRPQYNSNLKAIIVVSGVVWIFTYFWSNAAMVAYGFMPLQITIIGTTWGLVELFVATIVGAKLYNES